MRQVDGRGAGGNVFAGATRVQSLWSVVLAAGRGTRLATVTGGVPKQFWSPSGDRSLLEDTVARLAPLTDAVHTLTVVDDTHHSYVEHLQERASIGEVVYQPADRGTATGVLLATIVVSTCNPDAVVVVTPSDHGVTDDEEFRTGVREAATYVHAHRDDIVLLGVEPQSAAGDYGWIVTARERDAGSPTSTVASFVEKPPASAAERLYASGAVWNTMVLVARVEALLALYRRSAPDLAGAFECFRFLSPARREQQLRRLYEHLPTLDFSHDVLEHASGLQCLAWRSSVGWTDLGTPERLKAWLKRRGGSAHDRSPTTPPDPGGTVH
jgi:mannose-1-phosphate guanylyltransferase